MTSNIILNNIYSSLLAYQACEETIPRNFNHIRGLFFHRQKKQVNFRVNFFVWKIRHKIKSLLGHTELNFCWFASGFLIKALCVEFRKKGDLDGVNAFHLQCTTKVALTCKFKSLLVFGCRVKFYYGELADRPAKQNHLIIALSLFYRVITTENIQQL